MVTRMSDLSHANFDPTHEPTRRRGHRPRPAASLSPVLIALLLGAALALSACAEAVFIDGDTAEDTRVEDTADVAVEDTPSELEDVADTGDVGDTADEPDLSDANDVADEPDVIGDTTNDITSNCEVVSDECAPLTAGCSADRTTIDVCGRCGEIIRSTACTEGEICDDTGASPICRPCVDIECGPTSDDCTPGETTCNGWNTIQGCNPDGTFGSVLSCPSQGRCIGGNCTPGGGNTGDVCTQDVGLDPGCVGYRCICGSEYLATYGNSACTLANSALSTGYCTTRNCLENGCNDTSEICTDFTGTNLFGGLNFCVARGNCATRGNNCAVAGRPNTQCEELPVRETAGGFLSWELGCWIRDLAHIGEECTSNADCLGGTCVRETRGAESITYCTVSCGAIGDCPSFSECVERPGSDGNYICAARANSADCPRLDSDSFNIVSRNLATFGSPATSAVCYIRD